ncbi:MAG: hypothetical protein ACRD0W_03600 [Acidimicrobiales bacterium]
MTATITEELEGEGVKSFCDSYAQLLACVDDSAKPCPPGAPYEQDRSSPVRASVTDAQAVGEHMSSLANAARRVSGEALAQRLARGPAGSTVISGYELNAYRPEGQS